MNNLSAARGDSKGEINLQWDSDESAVSYMIEFASANRLNNIKWKMLDIISEPLYTVRKLKSNRNYYFRVASVKRNGKSELSNEIIKKAP